jgi:hypothetical protein
MFLRRDLFVAEVSEIAHDDKESIAIRSKGGGTRELDKYALTPFKLSLGIDSCSLSSSPTGRPKYEYGGDHAFTKSF